MSKKPVFGQWTEAEEDQYSDEAARRWDEKTVRQSQKLWKSYSAEKQQQIKDEGGAIYVDLAAAMPQGAESAAVQAIIARWHQHLRYFYEPTPEILAGLGHGYNNDPAFHATFAAVHPDLPAFMEVAITHYVAKLNA